MRMNNRHHDDFAIFEIPDDSNRPGSHFPPHPLYFPRTSSQICLLEGVKLGPSIHPWLSSRGLEFTSPGLDSKGYMYDEMIASEQKPVAKLVVKKWVYDGIRLTDLFSDTVALKIIFEQAKADLKNNLIFPTADERADLRKLALESSAREVRHIPSPLCLSCSPPHLPLI